MTSLSESGSSTAKMLNQKDMKVLLVAPHTDLAYRDEEIASVVNTLRPTLLSGNVVVSSLIEQANKQWDLIWFASHGTKDGILLSDGMLPTAQLTTIIRSSGAQAVFLNTCESLGVALSIHNELQIAFVCTIQAVPDLTAYVTGRSFARQLADTGSVQEAYVRSKPGGNDSYIYLHGRNMENNNPYRPYKSFSTSESDEVLKDLRQLILMVKGDKDLGHVGIMQRLDDLQNNIELFHDDYQNFRQENKEKWILLENTLKFYRTGMFMILGIYILTLIGILSLLVVTMGN